MHDTGKGYNLQVFLGALLHNTFSSGKTPSPKAKLPPVYLDMPAHSGLIDSCTQAYRDWMEDFLAPAGSERSPPEEHFIWLSTAHQPYTHNPGSPFIPPDFTLGLPPIQDWTCQTGEPPWALDLKDCSKPIPNCLVPADSTDTSSMDEGKQKKKKKKHRHSKKVELKVTTRGQGTDNLVWTNTGSTSSASGSQSEGDSGLGSNPSHRSHRVTNTEPDGKSLFGPVQKPEEIPLRF